MELFTNMAVAREENNPTGIARLRRGRSNLRLTTRESNNEKGNLFTEEIAALPTSTRLGINNYGVCASLRKPHIEIRHRAGMPYGTTASILTDRLHNVVLSVNNFQLALYLPAVAGTAISTTRVNSLFGSTKV